MKIRPDFRMALLAAALAATAASAYAAYSSSLIPALTADTPQAQAEAEGAAAPAPIVTNEMGLAPNESIVIEEVERPASAPRVVARRVPAPAPIVETAHSGNSITITKPRLTEDQRIHAEVMEVLAANPRLTGRVGVESRDRVVHLSGHLATPGQVDLAERDARRIRGVRAVQNEIQSRIGIRRS